MLLLKIIKSSPLVYTHNSNTLCHVVQMGPNSGLHIIIFDEIDAICKARGSVAGSTAVHDTVVNQLLSKIDGVDQLNNILVIGTFHSVYLFLTTTLYDIFINVLKHQSKFVKFVILRVVSLTEKLMVTGLEIGSNFKH